MDQCGRKTSRTVSLSSREVFPGFSTGGRVWCRMSSAVADSGTVQTLTSLAIAPKQRLFHADPL